jgi:hypothetical protein
MVFVCSLSHGIYSGRSFQVPNNIKLVTYTAPRVYLSIYNTFPILYQILNRVNERECEIKPEILDLENSSSDETYEIKSIPTIEITSIHVPYPNDKRRKIGDKFKPEGKFSFHNPCSETDDLEIEFAGSMPEAARQLSTSDTYMQTPLGSVTKKENRKTRFPFSIWLNEISEIYKDMYPNKVITVLHLSCRHEQDKPYVSVDELANDLENISVKEDGVIGIPDYRPHFHGESKRDALKSVYLSGVEGYKRILHKSFILTKSPDVKHEECVKIPLISSPIHIPKYLKQKKETGGRTKYKKKKAYRKASRKVIG